MGYTYTPKMLYSEDKKQKPAFLHKPIKKNSCKLKKGDRRARKQREQHNNFKRSLI
jgi:hypothetical protein